MSDDLDDLAAAANPNLAPRPEPTQPAGYSYPLIPTSPVWPAPYYGDQSQPDPGQQQQADGLSQLAAVSNTSLNVHVHSPAYRPAKTHSPFAWGFGITIGVVIAIVCCCILMTFVGTCSNAVREHDRSGRTYER